MRRASELQYYGLKDEFKRMRPTPEELLEFARITLFPFDSVKAAIPPMANNVTKE